MPPAPDSVTDAVTTALWLDQLAPSPRRPPLDGDAEVDVAIVGGGFSGLWTAYYLHRLDPTLRILVVEREYCGFGASGRNGGWAVGELAGSIEKYTRMAGEAEAIRQARAVFDAVDEIGRVSVEEGIDCGYTKGGWIRLARNGPQARRQREEVVHEHARGFTDDEIRLLEPDEARAQMNATRVEGGIHFSPCASLDPARLVRGLADVVETAGVRIVENTPVTRIEPGRIHVEGGVVRADVVVRSTEAYTRDLHGERRTVLPVYSLMIATEPLPDHRFDEIGLAGRPTFSDDRYMVIYGQRTEDNRLAFGGRGVPYLFGSRIARSAELHEPSHHLIHRTLVEMLPMLDDVAITHRWGGVLGIPRDWVPGLRFDRATGEGSLGGYVGEGVAAANLAGRTMAELIVGHATDRTSLPWVGHRSRRWEPEPLRWLGVRSSRRILAAADTREDRTDEEASLAFRMSRVLRGA